MRRNITAWIARAIFWGILTNGAVIPHALALDPRVSNTSLSVPEVPETFGYQTENAFPGLSFTRPVAVVSRPGDTDSLFVVEQSGIIYIIPDITSPSKSVFLDIRSQVDSSLGEEGLYCLVFHPDWETNGYFYVHYTIDTTTSAGSGRHGRISRFQVDPADTNQALSGSEQPLITQFDQASNHNGGEMMFGPDGYLYASLGDEGGGGDEYNNSRFINKDFFSAIIRIDVDKLPGNLEPNTHPAIHLDGSSLAYYSIPSDNPFIGATSFNGETIDSNTVRTEFWAAGFRNPWRFSFDETTGLLYCPDVGQDLYEEVNIVSKGGDYGWSLREGFHPFDGNTVPAGVVLEDPILEYPQTGGPTIPGGKAEGKSISGGVVYHGNRISQLESYYVFGDYVSNRIFAFYYDPVAETVSDFQQLASVTNPVSFGSDPTNGDVLIVSLDGTIFRLLYSDTPISGSPLPTTLSGTGAFSDLSTLAPESGIEPYDINVPFWSDHAIKSRWFSVPDLADTIGFDETENWTFPDGTVWIKHFDMEMVEGDPASRRRLETRFIVKNSEGAHGFTYKWNAEETEAFLVAEEGEEEVLTILDSEGAVVRDQTWRYPSRSECLQCHTSVGGHALGFGSLQLNKFYDYGSGSVNQIDALDDAGYFDAPAPDPSTIEKIVPTSDSSASIEEKARSYLQSNCVQCHQPGGPSLGNWDARYLTDLASSGIIDGDLVNDNGDPDNKVIASGDTDHSMILQRISVRGAQQMPPLGSNELDQNGIAIMTSWIQSLGGSVSPTLTQSRSSFTFTEGDGATVIDSGFSVSDTGTSDFNGGSLIIQFSGQDGVDDTLAIENQGTGAGQISTASNSVSYEGNPIGTFAGGDAFLNPLVISFDNTTTLAAVTALGQAITLNNTSSTPLTFDRTVELNLIDGSSQSSNTLIYTVSINSLPEDPSINWDDPSGIVYGTTLSGTQLNASANVAGTFVYDPDVGALLDAGLGQPLQATFTPDDLDNYNVVVATASIDVAKGSATLIADNAQRPYGSANPGLTYSAAGLVAGDTILDIDTPPNLSTNAVNSSSVGSYSITLSGASDSNYNFSYTPGELTIQPVPLTITADNKARVYGQSNPALSATYSGFVLSDGPSDLDTSASLFTSATASSPSGSYTITVSGATSTNYSITHQNGVLDIAKAAATITATNAQKTYGSPNPAFSFTVSGFVNGDTISDIDTPPTLSTSASQSSPVGGYSITPSGGDDNNYAFSYAPGTLTVEPAPLTITAEDKARGFGQPNPTLTATYSGFVLGEGPANLDVQPALQTAADAGSPVGDYAIDASGAADANYAIAYQSGTLTISKAVATITASDAQRAYGSPNPGFSYTVSGLLNGDTPADIDTPPALSTAAGATSPAGDYAITASGASDADYDFAYAPGTLTVEPVPLTVTADDKARVYGGLNPTLTATYSGFVLGEGPQDLDAPAALATAATSASPAGNYAITASGAASSNYTFTYAPGTLTVGRAAATLIASSAQRAYGSPNPAFSYTATGLVNGDTTLEDIDVQPTLGTSASQSSPPGSYTISISGASDPNYNFTYQAGSLEINPALLTIKADNKERPYGQPNPELTATYSGLVLGEGPQDLASPAVLQTSATVESPSDLYDITVSGASDPKYSITFQGGYLSVGKTLVTLTADDSQRNYGSPNPVFTFTASGFINGDTIADIETPPTLSTSATAGSDVGAYAINLSGAADSNYFFAYQPGTLDINPVTLSVSTPDQDRTYGSANPQFPIVYQGFVQGDTAADLDTQPTAVTTALLDSPVGSYSITPSGGADNNYAFSYTPGTLTVEPAPLTITANDKARGFGQPNPTLTATYSGFVLGEGPANLDVQPSLQTAADAGSPVGDYAIDASGAADANYAIAYQSGTLSISKAIATITASNAQRAYGSANPGFSYTVSGLLNGDTPADIDTPPALSTAAGATSPAGDYAITASGAADADYDFAYAPGTLTVEPVPLTVTANNKARVYGGLNPTLTATYSGFVLGEGPQDLDAPAALATAATSASPVGDYAIAASGAASQNYTFTYAPGTLTVGRAPATLVASSSQRAYGSPNPGFSYTATGLVNGDTISDIDTPPTLSTAATASSSPGAYPINPTGASDNNYSFSYTPGVLTVNPAPLLVTAENKARSYGQTNPALTAVYNGFVLGEGPQDLNVPPTLQTTATNTSPAGVYPITVSGTSSPNYSITHQSGTLSVGKALATLNATDSARPYGSENPNLSFTVTGLLNGDTAGDIDTPPTLSTEASSSSPTGSYAITISGAADDDYNFVYQAGTLTVEPISLTVTADDKTRVYGELNPGLTASYSGFVLGEGPESLDTPAGLSTVATSASPAGTYPITASGAASSNYVFSYQSGTLTVDKATATLAADDASKTYGSPNPTFSYTVSGLVNGDVSIEDIDLPPTLSTLATQSSAPGNYEISISGASDPNYDFLYLPGILDVDPAPLTISADDKERAFGQSNPELTASYSGFVLDEGPGDLDTPAVLQTAATSESPSDLYEITVSGASDPNYAITFRSGNLSVGRTLVTLTANDYQKTYGDPNPEFTYTASGFVNGDTIADIDTPPTLTTTATQESGTGTYAINISGALDENYFFSHQPGTLDIEPATLSVSTPNQTKAYGSANPAFPIEYQGFVLDDNAANLDKVPVALTPALIDSPVGEFSIQLSGGSDTNYSFNYTPATLTVEPVPLVISADDKSRSYGKPNPTLTASYSGFVLGEGPQNLDTPVNLSTVAAASSAAGTYPIVASGASDANYSVSFNIGSLNISKAIATLTASDAERDYGSPNPDFVFTASGLVNSDTIDSFDTPPSLSTSAVIDSAAGTFSIDIAGAEDTNYNFVYNPGLLTVNPAPLTISAADQSKVYGQPNPELTLLFSGFALGQGPEDLGIPAVAETSATESSPAGFYPITITGGESANYSTSLVEGTLTVSKASVLLTAENKSKLYGSPNPEFTFVAEGLVDGVGIEEIDTPPVMTTLSNQASPAGNYNIEISGASDLNYEFTYKPGNLLVERTPLSIVADNITREFGQPNPELTATYTGFVLGEGPQDLDSPAILETDATIDSPNGLYEINLSGAEDPNYQITLKNGFVSIGRSLATLLANNAQKVYGSENPVFTFTAVGLMNGDSEADIDTQPTLTSSAVPASDVGEYTINVIGAEDPNYFFVYEPGTLEILQKTLTAKPADESRYYGSPNPEFTVLYEGFQLDDSIDNLDTPPIASTNATVESDVGEYEIDLSEGADNNYRFETLSGTLSIQPAPLTIIADDKTRQYGMENPPLTATASGLVLDDDLSDLDTPISLTVEATVDSLPGHYPINTGNATDSNYDIQLYDGTLSIGPVNGRFEIVFDQVTKQSFIQFTGVPLSDYTIEFSDNLVIWDFLATTTTDSIGFASHPLPVGESPFENVFFRVALSPKE